MMMLYKAMIRSRVEYCSPLWNPSKIGDIQTLENVQRSFTSKIDGYSSLNYYQRLAKLKLTSLQRHRERYSIIHVFKVLHNMSPNDSKISFIYSDRRGIQAVVPPLRKHPSKLAQHKYDSSFSVLGPKLWNTIPKATTLKTTLSGFKSSLQKFLDEIPDEPPTRGYTTANSNSLLHWRGQTLCGGLRTARWPR